MMIMNDEKKVQAAIAVLLLTASPLIPVVGEVTSSLLGSSIGGSFTVGNLLGLISAAAAYLLWTGKITKISL